MNCNVCVCVCELSTDLGLKLSVIADSGLASRNQCKGCGDL